MATITTSPTQQRAIEMNVLARKQRSLWGDAFWRLRRNKAAMVGLAVIAAAALMAIFAPLILVSVLSFLHTSSNVKGRPSRIRRGHRRRPPHSPRIPRPQHHLR